MGLEHLFAGMLASWIIDKREEKKILAATREKNENISTRKTAVMNERAFVDRRKKKISIEYKSFADELYNCGEMDSHFLLQANEKYCILDYYRRLEIAPYSVDCRTAFISYLFYLWNCKGSVGLMQMLQNELAYLIDCVNPRDSKERMYQHLAMFLSSECYFLHGEFGNALKRLYKILDWREIYASVEDEDGFDFNGLADFHEAVIANIMSIYALVGLKYKAIEFSNSCSYVISQIKDLHRMAKNNTLSDRSFCEYMDNASRVLSASDQIEGYYFIGDTSPSQNLFEDACYGSVYSIPCLLTQKKHISVNNSNGLYYGQHGNYPTLFFEEKGGIINYKAAIERERKIVENI